MSSAIHHVEVVVADDHPIILMAVTNALGTLGFHVRSKVRSGAELLDELARDGPCGLIVTDFTMQGDRDEEDGLRLIGRLRRLYPDTPVVVFTMLTNGGILNRLCSLGVAGIVSKEESESTLAQICHRALGANQTLLSPRIAMRLGQDGGTTEAFRNTNPLSPSELEVVRLFSLGLSVTDISRRLNRAVTTVATQKRMAMRKLHVETNADLIRYASQHGFR
ncbi:response regulator transcription factor [Cupriavidus metallidurans]|uniref:response regulator transcription factor n=1 Tax=Cupriavidus TaxID=106589 RepID=UPI00055EBFAF|nr:MULTISPECIES: response regulator transcription factor [Cupriavidus]HBD36475.1 DNA-binding response regulator [Cupriavidus sp.]HBO80809.1 DNA-binding response regulator [Cupriavidus sp.]